MTSEKISDNKDSKKTDDREEELLNLQKQSSELVGGIKQNTEDSSKAIHNLEGYTNQAIDDFKKDAEEFVNYGKRVVTNAKNSLDQISKKAIQSIDSALNYFRIFIIVTIVALAAVGVIGGYLFHVYIAEYELHFFGTWGLLSLITLVSLWYLRDSLDKEGLTFEASKEKEALVEEANCRPNQTHNLSPLKRFVKAASNGVNSLTSNALELIPTTNQLITHQNKKIKQQQFVKNFVFALRRYEIDVTDEAEQIMITKSWRFDDKERWLADLSNGMNSIFNSLDAKLFQLFYYEFFDDKYASVLWTDIQKNEKLRNQIANHLIREGIIGTPDEENSLKILSKLLERISQYSLEETKNRGINFFKTLRKFKESCIRHLEFFGINIHEKKEVLMQFVPDSNDMNNWRNDVICYISQIISKNPIIIKLLVLSAEGDYGSSKIWTDIQETNKTEELDELANILTLKRIRPKFGDFTDKSFHEHLKLAMLKTSNSFSLLDIETNLHEIEAEILKIKYRIGRTLTEFKLGSINSNIFSEYVPSINLKIEKQLKEIVTNKLKIDLELFSLLYSTANGLDDAQDLYQKLKESSKITKLGDLLLKNSFVNESKFSVNIVLVLKTQVSFELGLFISIYSKYERLFECLETFYPFLQNNGVLVVNQPLEFNQIAKIAPVSSLSSLEDQLERIALNLVGTDSEKCENKNDVTNIALAATTVFMRVHGYSGYSKLCRKASKKEFELASKIIFNYTKIFAEERLSGSKETLKNAIKRSLKKNGDIYNYEFFKSELADGKLEPNAVFLESRWKQEIRTEFKNLKNQGFETGALKNYVDSIKSILKQEISGNIIKEFLITQVLSAYLLTVPGIYPGIGFVRDEMTYIRQAELELSEEKNDVSYRNLIRVSPGGGKATRIGLVPLELDFDEFSEKFNQVWERAVKLHNKKDVYNRYPEPLPVYLVRIFPSDDGLKEIMPSLDLKTKPLETIRALIHESVSNEDSVSLLSIIQNVPSGKLALISVIRAIFDSPKSNLYLMIKNQVDKIVVKSKSLIDSFEKKTIETKLLHHYEADHISNLGMKLAERVNNVGEEVAFNEFKESLNDVFQKEVKLSSNEVEVVLKTLFANIKSVGLVSSI